MTREVSMDLEGKNVVITGAGGALGGVVVRKATALGARVTSVDLAAAPGDHAVALDLTDAATTVTALGGLGEVDALLHLAGGFGMGPTGYDPDPALWDAMFRLNVTTLQNAVRALVPGMIERGRGSIVTVGARSAERGAAGMSAYIAAKGSVMRLTESLSAELRGHGINVNAVLPTIIDTPANRGDMPDADPARWVAPDDLANVICFLASDAARAVHGALVPVTGLS